MQHNKPIINTNANDTFIKLSKFFSHNTIINFITRFRKLHGRRRRLMPKPLFLGIRLKRENPAL